MCPNNTSIVDLNKVQYATFFWRNQYGRLYKHRPEQPSVNGRHIPVDEMAYPHVDYPNETSRERAKRLDLLEKFTPVIKFQLTANHNIEFVGQKAIELWNAWRAKILKHESKSNNTK